VTQAPPVERFEASNGAEIFRIPVQAFPNYYAYAHLILYREHVILVDTGSGFGTSHDDLINGFETINTNSKLSLSVSDVTRVVITHGHIDHFGGLAKVSEQAPDALVGSHALTRPVLVNHDERVLIASRAMDDFLRRAGIPDDHRGALHQMFMLGKQAFEPIPPDFTLNDSDMIDDFIEVIHVPGHAPGLIMLRVGNFLLTADHILPKTSVALAPESIMAYTGVGHYIESLEKAAQINGIDVAAGGHEAAMHDYKSVVANTLKQAHAKVDLVLGLCDIPRSIFEIACEIYSNLDGYGELLKLEQTGARIEYLHQRGLVMVENLSELESQPSPVLRYVKT